MAGSAIAAVVSSFVADAVATEVAFSLAGAVVTGAEVWAGSELLIGSVVGGVTGMAASSLVGGIVNNALAPDQPSTSQLSAYEKRGLLVNVSSNVEQIPVIYGSRRVGGARVFVCASGASNEYLNLVIVMGEGDISAVNNIYINDVISTDARFNGLVTVNAHLGTDGQTVDTMLNAALPAQWDSTHRLQGVAYAAVQLKYDQTAFPSGLPTLTFDVSGRTLYDPRDASTRFSNNPALAIRDYLTNARYGRGIATSSVDDASFIAAANHCDELVSIPDGSGGTTTQKRYSCDGLVDTGNTAYDNIKALLTTCRGMLIFSGGKYRLVIDKSETAAFTFNEDNITGSWQIAQQGKRAKYNRIRAGFFNPARSWQPDIAIQESATWRAADNGLILEKQLDLPFTADIYRAQRIAQQEMIQSRFGLLVRFTAFQEGLRCEVGDVVQISHATPGWVNKLFRVIQIELKNNDEVFVVCREYDASVYAPVPNLAANPAPSTNLPDPSQVGKPGYPALTETLYSSPGGIKSRMTLTWAASNDAFVRYYQAEYKLTTASSWNILLAMSNSASVDDVAPGKYDLRVKALNALLASSAYSTNQGNIVGPASLPLANVQNLVSFFQDGLTILAWDAVSDIRPIDYEIRVGSTWSSAQVLGRTPLTRFATVGNGTYWVAAHYSAQNGLNVYSSAPASIVIAGAALTRNVIASYDEYALGWPGTLSGGAVIQSGNIILRGAGDILAAANILAEPDVLWYGGVAPSGEYDLPSGHAVNIGRVAPCGVMIGYTVRGQSIYDNVLTLPAALAVSDWLGDALGVKVGVQPQIALAQADGIYGAWQNFVPGTYNAQYFKARALISSSDPQVTAIVSGLTFMVDVPDRMVDGNVQVAAGGMSVVYSPAFNGGVNGNPVPLPQITILNAQAGDDVILSAQTLSGFTVQVVNAGAGVARNINYKSQGY